MARPNPPRSVPARLVPPAPVFGICAGICAGAWAGLAAVALAVVDTVLVTPVVEATVPFAPSR